MDFSTFLLSLPVLSVRQPWASYLVSGLKNIELRTWSSQYLGWLWIHTGKKPDTVAMEMLKLQSDDFQCGGLVGLAKIEDYHIIDTEKKWRSLQSEHLSPGSFSKPCYGWQISEVLSLPEIIECPGELGLFYLSGGSYQKACQELAGNNYRDFIKYAQKSILPNAGTLSN